jgi:type I restriction enzyme, S subunit
MKTTGWTQRRLDELGFVGRGKSRHRPRNEPSLYGGPYPFIQTADIMAAAPYITTYSETYSELGLRQSKMWPANTLCMTIAGANTAKVAILKIEACFPDSVVGFIPDKSKADLHFVLYALGLMKDQFLAVSRGATQDNLALNKLLSFPLLVPDLREQRRISAILSAYDELIENNKRRITLLEKLAEEIYREWFVRFRFPGHEKIKIVKGVPQGWEQKHLPEIANITYGFPFDGSRFNAEARGKPIIRIRNIPESATSDFTDETADDKYIVRHGDLLVGMDGEFHINHWHGDDALLVQRVCRMKAKNPVFEGYLAHAIRAPIKHFESILMGATVGHLGAVHLKSIVLLVPPEPLHEHLCILNDIHRQKLLLAKAARNLGEIRDRLLPRLISGQLSVENLDIQFPPSMTEELEPASTASLHV